MENNIDNPSIRRPRVTPRNSDLEEAIAAAAAKDTPWRTLNQLANIPRTPLQRASSAGPSSTQRSNRRTPAARTPGAAQRLGSAKRTIAVTPHGRAAQRELDLRRAGLTPGKERRRSGRQQRETPRDTLRALSRLMAPKSRVVISTPQGPSASTAQPSGFGQDDWEDGPDPERPRLSLPIGDDQDEDDSLLLPPQSAGLEDENFTVQSVELGRRARSEQPLSRLSRGSFGSLRLSDAFADLNESGLDGLGDVYDSSIMAGGAFGDDYVAFIDDGDEPQGENTGALRGLGLDRGRVSIAGRDSDIRPLDLPDDTESTFVFNVPPRAVSQDPQPDNFSESSDKELEDGEEENAGDDQANGIDTEELDRGTLLDLEGDISMQDATMQDVNVNAKAVERRKVSRRKKVMISKYGIHYPSLPAGVVKRLAMTFARTAGNSKAKLNNETLNAIIQASDWFFEQVSDDLGAYSKHAGRKTIDESDIVTLMARQRQTNATSTPFSLAQKYLPRELLQDLRMAAPSKLQKGRQLHRADKPEENEG